MSNPIALIGRAATYLLLLLAAYAAATWLPGPGLELRGLTVGGVGTPFA